MSHQKNIQIIPVFDLFYPELKGFWTLVRELCRAVDDAGGSSMPAWTWSLPARVFSSWGKDTERGIDAIKERVADRGDKLISAGFSGAHHGLLLDEEMKKELSWGISNPWGTGMKDLFRRDPVAAAATGIDVNRTSAQIIYGKFQYPLIVPIQSSSPSGISILRSRERSYSLQSVRPALYEPKQLIKTVRNLINRGTSLLLWFVELDRRSIHVMASIPSVLDRLAAKGCNLSFPGFGPDTPDRLIIDVSAPKETPIPHTPGFKAVRSRAFRYRTRESDSYPDDRIRQVLLTTAGNSKASENGCPEPEMTPIRASDRSLIAHMPGTVSIAERDQEVRFENGRLSEILSGGRSITIPRPSTSYITVPKSTIPFSQSSVFSFEDEYMRGLRELLMPPEQEPGRGGRIIIDYFFVEDLPQLFISVHAEYPDMDAEQILSFAPLEKVLFRYSRDEHVKLTASYPDGQIYHKTIPADEVVWALPGSSFVFHYQDLHLEIRFPELKEVPVHVLPVKTVRKKKEYFLLINPLGSYTPSSPGEVCRFGEHATMVIKGSTGEHPEPVVIPSHAMEKLSHSWIERCR